MTYHEIQDALHEDEEGWTLGSEGEELLRWLLKNYKIVHLTDRIVDYDDDPKMGFSGG